MTVVRRTTARVAPSRRMMPRARLQAAWLLAAVILTSIAVRGVAGALDANARNNYVDFGVFYRAAACLVSGCNPYELAPGQLAPNLAPPHALVFFLPLQFWSIGSAYLAWLIVSVTVVAVCAWLVVLELRLSASWVSWAAMAAAVASSGLMTGSVTSGNYYPLLAAPMTLAWVAWRRGGMGRAACWLGVAASFKVLLLLPLLWFVIHREYRAAAIMVAAWTSVFLAGVLALGANPYAGWLAILARAPMDAQFHDASLLQFAQRALTSTPQYAPMLLAPTAVRPFWALLAGLVVATALSIRRDADRTLLTVVAAAILAAPIGWVFGCWWLMGPAAGVWLSGNQATRRLLALAGAGLWLPDATPLWGQPSPWLTVTLGSLNMWVALALLWAGCVPGARTRPGLR